MTAIAPSAPSSFPARDALVRVALAGLAGGAIDMVYASAMGAVFGHGVVRVWQGVASGWVGKAAALQGGLATAGLGLLTHYGIAICMAGAYALVAARAPVLYRRWPVLAPLYGVLLYLIMYRIVLPLRFPGAGGWDGARSVADVLVHMALATLAAFVLSRPSRNNPQA